MTTPAIQLGDDRSEAERDSRPAVRVHSVFKYDPDADLDKISTLLDTKIVNVNAKIWEGAPSAHRYRAQARTHFRSATDFFRSKYVRSRIREAYKNDDLKDLKERLKENFTDYPDERATDPSKVFSLSDGALPSVFGPSSRQMPLYDVLDQYRKAREAAYRNPIGKRIIKLVASFVLSRGVKGSHVDPDYQDAWMAFWKQNGMRLRTKTILRELLTYGDQFLRYFKTKDGLLVRSLDPETIWEIVTNPEDIEDVLFYHQQYVTPTQMIVGAYDRASLPSSTLIIRQIPAADIDHFKINCGGSEKRGRSELYAILSWLVRFKEFANDRIILAKMQSMFALDVAVDGSPQDVNAANEQFATPPGSGSVLVHNSKVAVEFKNANKNANESKTDAEMILKIIAVGSGVSEQFLGVSYNSSRATALVQTEPDVKNFEDYREIVEEILLKAADRVFDAKGLAEPEAAMEFTFPALASEDRSNKVKDIALSESMGYFSKKRAAEMTAREFDITNYDFDREQEQIDEEAKDSPVIAMANQQVEKVAPSQLDLVAAQAAAKPGPKESAKGGDSKPLVHTGAQMGFKGDGGGRGLPRTKASIARNTFSRGGEKKRIQNNQTSATPRIDEATSMTDPVFSSRRGWTEQARTQSVITRKKRRLARIMLMQESATAELAALEKTPDPPTE